MNFKWISGMPNDMNFKFISEDAWDYFVTFFNKHEDDCEILPDHIYKVVSDAGDSLNDEFKLYCWKNNLKNITQIWETFWWGIYDEPLWITNKEFQINLSTMKKFCQLMVSYYKQLSIEKELEELNEEFS